MPMFTRRPSDWDPVPEEALLIASPSRQKFHRTDCEWAEYVRQGSPHYYLTVAHAQRDGYRTCRTCMAEYHQPLALRELPVDDVLAAFERQLANHTEDVKSEANDISSQLTELLSDIDALVARSSFEDAEVKWPVGRLVGAMVRVRWPDGTKDDLRLVAGDDEFGNGRDRVSIGAPLGKAITSAEVGDTVTFKAPGGLQKVTVLSIALPDDWTMYTEES